MLNIEEGDGRGAGDDGSGENVFCNLNGLDRRNVVFKLDNKNGIEEIYELRMTNGLNVKLNDEETTGILIISDDEGVEHRLPVVCPSELGEVEVGKKEDDGSIIKSNISNQIKKNLKHKLEESSEDDDEIYSKKMRFTEEEESSEDSTINSDQMSDIDTSKSKESDEELCSCDESSSETLSGICQCHENEISEEISLSTFRLRTINPELKDMELRKENKRKLNSSTELLNDRTKNETSFHLKSMKNYKNELNMENNSELDNTSKLTESLNPSYYKPSTVTKMNNTRKPANVIIKRLKNVNSKISCRGDSIKIRRINQMDSINDELPMETSITKTLVDEETVRIIPPDILRTKSPRIISKTSITKSEKKKVNLSDCNIEDNPKINQIEGINRLVTCDLKKKNILEFSDILELLVRIDNSRIGFVQWMKMNTRIKDKDLIVLMTSIERFMNVNLKLLDEENSNTEQCSTLISHNKSRTLMESIRERMNENESSLFSIEELNNNSKSSTQHTTDKLTKKKTIKKSYNTRSRTKSAIVNPYSDF
ncbi:hypothetical protein SNEBB_002532 [Seison nebaliae]|nr:hypothetical protein SNEBB_002532 [Seison nebaliae]